MSYAAKEMKRLMGKAIHRHQMIRDGDHVLVAVSGGGDSLSLLWLLRDRIRRIPINYRITAIHVDPGFGGDGTDKVENFLEGEGFDYRIIRTRIGPMAHSPENRENPCFLCSRLRRKALFEAARDLGCRVLAFGHH
jgi:tRNA 2-thiocytidine biosynthesis protein TtcA